MDPMSKRRTRNAKHAERARRSEARHAARASASKGTLGSKGGRRLPGSRLSLQEMKEARAYFAKRGRPPTDVELEALGQAWSEHCCYKSSKPVLKRHVYGIAEGKIICREDAGVLPFDGDWCYVPKLES